MQLIISIVAPFDFPRQVEYSCVISLSAASLPRTITIPNATARSSPTVFLRGRRRARTSDLMIRSPPPRWDSIESNCIRSLPALGRIERYRIGEDQSAGAANTEQCPPPSISRNGGYGVEYPRLPASVCLDAGEPHHLGPLLGFRGDEAAKVGGRARNHCTAQIGKPRLDFGISKAGVDLLV